MAERQKIMEMEGNYRQFVNPSSRSCLACFHKSASKKFGQAALLIFGLSKARGKSIPHGIDFMRFSRYQHQIKILNLNCLRPIFTRWAVICTVMLLAPVVMQAQAVASPPHIPQHRVFIDPGTTTVSLGKVSLIVSPLSHFGKYYIGEYAIKVAPYFFKNESGSLELEGSVDMEQKLTKGLAVKFIGKATNKKNGKTKVIVGKATPATNEHGSVTFSIETKNGVMIFNTFYHFGE